MANSLSPSVLDRIEGVKENVQPVKRGRDAARVGLGLAQPRDLREREKQCVADGRAGAGGHWPHKPDRERARRTQAAGAWWHAVESIPLARAEHTPQPLPAPLPHDAHSLATPVPLPRRAWESRVAAAGSSDDPLRVWRE
jgi:hypothetical protein